MQETLRMRLAGGPDAAGRARAAMRAFNGNLAGLHDTIRLLVSELVTNAVRHAGAGERETIELVMAASPERVRVEVRDRGPGLDPSDRPAEPGEKGGFGLMLVEQLADRWGVDREDRSRVWFEIDRH